MKKYLAESALIVFSVLFALLINKLFDDYQQTQRAQEALQSIKQEIIRNQAVINTWTESHKKMLEKIIEYNRSNDITLKQSITESGYFDFSKISSEGSLVDATLIDASWRTAINVGVLKEVDYKTLEAITQVYELQEVINDRTIQSIVNFYFQPSTHSDEHIEDTLMQLQLRFLELTGQEVVLGGLYANAIDLLED